MRETHVVHLRGPAALALAIAVLTIGGIFLILGVALLAGLGVIGAAAAGTYVLWRRVTGRPLLGPPRERPLDPSMEVLPAGSDWRGRLAAPDTSRGLPDDLHQ